ncbi:MAG: DegT/DnrJ/EryC1/StrS family aminotransferase [Deltaproteobacteria bacterium]|nr:DegT/DnrJ/EryC1/StrS family aminotransferase [Deltaproteobacteria bacterium]
MSETLPAIRVPLAEVELGDPEIEAVVAVLRSRWLTAGPTVERFEAALAALAGVPHAVAVSNCTAALHLAYLALGVGPGDEVLVPTLSFVASANMACACGARPVFVDCLGEDDFNIDPTDLERRITPRTKAICVVHYGGYPCRIDEVLALAARHALPIVEDCAHAPGGTFRGRPLGSFGEIGCQSFFGNKNITTGEGGACLTRSDELAGRLRLLRSHGMTTMTWDRHRGHASTYDVALAGLNYRLDELRAAIGLCQLERLADHNARRGRAVRRYRRVLAERLPQIRIPFAAAEESTFHIFPVLLPAGTDRPGVIARMRAAGVQTSVHYPPTHTFTAYRGSSPALPRAEALAPRILTLPLYPRLGDEDIGFVVDSLRAAL